MNKLLWYLILILVQVLHIKCTSPNEKWNTITDTSGRYRIMFPSVEEINTIEEEALPYLGKLTWYKKSSYIEPNDSNIFFSVKYTDLNDFSSDSIKYVYSLFDYIIKEINQHQQNQLIKIRAQNILDYPGKLYRWHWASKKYAKSECIYLVNNRIYLITAQIKFKDDYSKDVIQFINSLDLINTPKNPDKTFVFKYPIIDYAINFPTDGETKMDSAVVEDNGVLIPCIITVFERNTFINNNKSFSMGVGNLSGFSEVISEDTVKMLFDTALDRLKTIAQGKIIKHTISLYKNYPCLDYCGTYFEEGVVYNRMIISKNKQYVLSVMSKTYEEVNEERDKFFSSFEIK